MKTKHNTLLCTSALAAILVFTGQITHAQTAVSSGDWDTPGTWDTDTVPTGNSEAFIPDGYVIGKSAGTSAARAKVGSNAAGGTLNISGGTINSANNTVSAHQIGLASNSSGTINVTGGQLSTTGANGGGIQVAGGEDSTGLLNISSGTITTTSGIHLGIGANATGTMTVSGGTVTTSTGTGPNIANNANPNFFVGGIVNSIFNRNGVFEQTGGSVTVTDAAVDRPTIGVTTYWYMRVGNAQTENNNPVGTATITGGSLTANVMIGRNSNLTEAGGSGILTIGPAANVVGQSQAWEVSANGTLAFRLGVDDSFNAVDLTSVAVAEAIMFTQLGATLQIDGTEFVFSELHEPITLISFASGKGPSSTSLDNVNYSFVGFEPGMTPSLEWTDTALVLTVVPEPATSALLLGLCVLAGMMVVRRRRMAVGR